MRISGRLENYAEGAPNLRKWAVVAQELNIDWDECPFRDDLKQVCQYDDLAIILWYLYRERALIWATTSIPELDNLTVRRLLTDLAGYSVLRGYLAQNSRLKHTIVKV